MKKFDRFIVYDILCFILFAAYMAVLISGVTPENTAAPFKEEKLLDFSDGWKAEDGKPVSLSQLGDLITSAGQTIVLTHNTPGTGNADRDLCFRSKNIWFSVALDGKTVYDFHPNIGIYGSRSYGSAFHHITIPSGSSGNITITAQPIYNDNNCFFDMMKIGDSGAYYQWFMETHFLSFILCMIIVIFGFIMLILSFTLGRNEYTSYSLRSLAFFSMTLGAWAGLESTLILQMLAGWVSLLHGFNYMLLIFMGYPAVQFANSLMVKPKKLAARLDSAATAAVFVICITLNGLGLRDFHECLPIIHAFLFASAAAIIVLFVINEIYCRKNGISSTSLPVLIAFIIFAVFGLMDLIRYRISPSGVSNAGYFMRIGLLLFFMILFIRSMLQLFQRMKLASEAAAMRVAAYTDPLTGIGSRAAFVVREKELESSVLKGTIPAVMVCQFDANDLKRINDNFGHAAGDDFIRAVSEAIRSSFGKEGDCYRIGGDEFTVFLSGENLQKRFRKCHEEMNRSVDEFNLSGAAEEKLYIACGTAVYEKKAGLSLEDIEKEADRNMYEDKIRSKKAAGVLS